MWIVNHYWGQRLGYKCWSDPVLSGVSEDNDYARVKSRNVNTTVGYQPSAECGVRSAESRILRRMVARSDFGRFTGRLTIKITKGKDNMKFKTFGKLMMAVA